MKVVVVVPWAPNLMRPRSLRLIQHLSDRHEVHVVGAAWSEHDERTLRDLGGSSYRVVRMSHSSAALRAAWCLVTGKGSLQQAYMSSKEFALAIDNEIEKVSPDLVYFNVIRSAHLLPRERRCVAVIDLDETRSNYYGMLKNMSRNPLWRFVARTEESRMKRAEEAVYCDFDAVLLSSPADAYTAGEGAHLVRSPHLVGHNEWTFHDDSREQSILFVGRQSYRANFEAVIWFARKVFARLAEVHPNVKLRIIGERPVRAVRRLASERVEVSGRVPEVGSYYAAADVSVVPIQMATGVQMKFIESLASGVPTVCTPVVANGAGASAGAHCLVAESPGEWSAAVSSLLTDRDLAMRLSRAGRKWAAANYSDAEILASLDLAIDKARVVYRNRKAT